MKTLMFILAVILGANVALAQPNGTPNSVGIYFDQAGTVTGWDTPGMGTLYVLLTNPDLPSALSAWDLSIGIADELQNGNVSGFALPSSTADSAVLLNYQNDYGCAYSEPLIVTGDTFVLLEAVFGWYGNAADDDHACLWVYPSQFNPEVPGQINLLLEDGSVISAAYDIDAEAFAWIAHPYCTNLTGSCTGVVTSLGVPVAGAVIRFLDASEAVVASSETDETGYYFTPDEIPTGQYTQTVDYQEHYPYESPVTIYPGTNEFDVDLVPLPTGTVFGYVRYDGLPLSGVLVTCWTPTGSVACSAVTTDAGAYLMPVTLQLGSYLLRVDLIPYEPYEQLIMVEGGMNVFDIALTHAQIGTVSGVVSAGGTPLGGVTVDCLDPEGTTVFSWVTDDSGRYASASYIAMNDYTLVVDHFSYLHHEQTVYVDMGANEFDIELILAPVGILTGQVTADGAGEPLAATVSVYRADNGELIEEVSCDASGVYATSPLTYYDYQVRAWIQQYIPQIRPVTVAQSETVADFILEPANTSLLLIDDSESGSPAGSSASDRQSGFAASYGSEAASPSRSAYQILADLTRFGYAAEVVPAAAVNPTLFGDYDLVILSCSNNLYPLENSDLKTALLSYVQEGGHLLLEGGNLVARHGGDRVFRTQVLHCQTLTAHQAGDITVADSTAYILNHPNRITDTITLAYSGHGDSDAMLPAADAGIPMNWSSYFIRASVITYDPNVAPEGGQIVFFSWNYQAAGTGRDLLLENAVQWLLQEEVPSCTVSGTVLLANGLDHSGTVVAALPSGGQTVTGPDGSYTLENLYAGEYTISASKLFYSTEVVDVALTENEHLTGVDMVLDLASGAYLCAEPGLPISDGEVTSNPLFFPETGTIIEVWVFVDITHTDCSDLYVSLISPSGTEVLLHDGAAVGGAAIFGAYPLELTPAESLDALLGEESGGDWTLQISDGQVGNEGALNAWCVAVMRVEDVLPVGVQPLMVHTIDGMHLSWSYNLSVCDGFNLYRRTVTTSPVRLNDTLLSSPDGHITFVDHGEGLHPGQQVYYRYALVRDGFEVADGDEVAAVFLAGTPRILALHDNFPNPFNPSTTLSFELIQPGHVRLSVYDVTGRLIRTLIDEERAAATHSVTWDGVDQKGSRVASGTYYYTLITESIRATKKMVLIK